MRGFLLFLSLVTPAIIYTSMAHAKLSTEGFGSEGAPYQSAVFEYADHSNNIKSATVMISPSESGLQRLYFMLSIENENMCTAGDASTYSNIAQVNGKNIKVYVTCEKIDPSKPTFIVMTALTSKGDSWVVSQFKSKEKVNFKYLEWDVNFNANGFIEAWEKFGGNAF